MNILLVEEEINLTDKIIKCMHAHHYECDSVHDFRNGMNKIHSHIYDCVIMNYNVFVDDFQNTIRKILENKCKKIIILTKNILSRRDLSTPSETSYSPNIYYYAYGNFSEYDFGVFIHQVLKNEEKQPDQKAYIRQGKLEIFLTEKEVKIGGKNLVLTKSEYELLLLFVEKKETVLSKKVLAEHIYNGKRPEINNCNFIYSHIKNLKNKLNKAEFSNHIKTIYGIGYSWEN